MKKEKNMEIKKVLPHREPFLFVDGITRQEYMKDVEGYRDIPGEEFWVPGHFPENPVYPGVLQLEMMAQIGGFIFAKEDGTMENGEFAYLSKVDDFKLRRKVKIGDHVVVKATLLDGFPPYYKVRAVSTVAGRQVSEATITYTFLKEL